MDSHTPFRFSELDDTTRAHYSTLVKKVNLKSAAHKRPPLGKEEPSLPLVVSLSYSLFVEQCVKVIEDAILDTRPLARYLAGSDVQVGVPVVDFLRQETITDFILGRSWRKLQK